MVQALCGGGELPKSQAAVVKRPLVFWITHLASPYRVPVWRELVELGWDVNVIVVEKRLGARGAENRGADWLPTNFSGVRYFYLNTISFSVGRATMHIPMPTRSLPKVRISDVVLLGGWESPVYWKYYAVSRMSRRPVIGFYESTLATRRFREGVIAWFQKKLFKSYSAVVVPGAASRDAVYDLGVPPDKVFTGFNAVDVAEFSRRAMVARDRHQDSTRRDEWNLLYVGQLIARKRVEVLVDQVAEVSGTRLTVVGVGEQERSLRRIALSRGVADRVKFAGQVMNKDLPEIMAQHQVLCLISSEEVWGLVVNEALAAGLAVLVTESCGVSESVRSMRGVYVVRDDLSDLREQLVTARNEWRGFISEPEILKYTPGRFAEVFDSAFRSGVVSRKHR